MKQQLHALLTSNIGIAQPVAFTQLNVILVIILKATTINALLVEQVNTVGLLQTMNMMVTSVIVTTPQVTSAEKVPSPPSL